MTVTPFQLAGNLTEIVARNTQSTGVWRSAPITEDEMVRVGMELELYLQKLLAEWKADSMDELNSGDGMHRSIVLLCQKCAGELLSVGQDNGSRPRFDCRECGEKWTYAKSGWVPLNGN